MSLNPDPRDLVSEVVDGVGIIPCWHLEEVMYGDQAPPLEEIERDLRCWCEMYAVGFYGAPGADFSVDVGARVAKGAGQSYLVVENLS